MSYQRHQQPPPPPPPPTPPSQHGVDPALVNIFYQVDTDRSGAIDATELQQALSHTHLFHIDTVAIIMRCFDKDNDGHINMQEFAQL